MRPHAEEAEDSEEVAGPRRKMVGAEARGQAVGWWLDNFDGVQGMKIPAVLQTLYSSHFILSFVLS